MNIMFSPNTLPTTFYGNTSV